jgi:chorismate-pyruvate lyase
VTDPTRNTSEADLYTPSASRLATLFFADLAELGGFEPSSLNDFPSPYRTLLAHNEHMTVALESFHKSAVSVKVVAEWHDDASYARCSLLSRQSDGAVVQFGMMRIWLADLPEQAKQEIKSKQSPLGRVLIDHNLLREVELITLWQIEPGPILRQHLKVNGKAPLYGRTAQILVDERPTVQLLEIVTLECGTKD